MELTTKQALQKGIQSHRLGKTREADIFYSAILKLQPRHPDANHNMGVLAVDVGKAELALSYFKIATEVDPQNIQFWLSYIETLINLGRLHDAATVLKQAYENIPTSEELKKISKQLDEIKINQEKRSSSRNEKQVNLSNNIDIEKLMRKAKLKLKKVMLRKLSKYTSIF